MRILCLCTGNTCRSPMLATLLRRDLDAAGRHDVAVESAGTGAAMGEPASGGAMRAMTRRGLSLADHHSRNVVTLDFSDYDHVLAMTSAHAAAARAGGVPAARLLVVAAEQGGVPDPFGGDDDEYDACARVLEGFSITFVAGLAAAGLDPAAEQRARTAIDLVHASEPDKPVGKPAALAYADHVEAWISRLVAAPSAALRLAARCQHLERWAIPRSSYPMDRPSYHRWRRAVHERQGARAEELLRAAGVPAGLAARVRTLVAKHAAKDDSEGQALEDAACLTFLATELGDFAGKHPDYTREKFIDIIRRTWAKMSARGRELALGIPLADALAALVREAVTGA